MMGEQDDRPTPPEGMMPVVHATPRLPDVDPDAAPSMESFVPKPPRMPTVDDPRSRPTMHPSEVEVKNPDSERTNLRALMENVVGAHELRVQQMLAAHEQREMDDRGKLRSDVSELSQRVEKLSGSVHSKFDEAVRGWMLADFKEAATEIADRFLEPVGTLIKRVAELQETLLVHEIRWKRLDKLNLEELRAQHDRLVALVDRIQQELQAVRDRLDALMPQQAS